MSLFARAIARAAAKASELAVRLADLQEKWRARAGHPRRDSSAEALIVELPAHPIVTVATAQRFLGRSKQAVNEAIATLAENGILHPITLAKRNRAWEARNVFALIDAIEREIATPSDDEERVRASPHILMSSRRR
jgi:Fic family protein